MVLPRKPAWPWLGRAVALPDHQHPGLQHQVFAGLRLELAPNLVRAAHQRHVDRALGHRQPGDAGLAMGGAAIVRRVEPVDAERAHPAQRQPVQGGAAHGAEPHDHDVGSFSHGAE